MMLEVRRDNNNREIKINKYVQYLRPATSHLLVCLRYRVWELVRFVANGQTSTLNAIHSIIDFILVSSGQTTEYRR
jgi:hypothetical protein